jgi:hypothetical protein
MKAHIGLTLVAAAALVAGAAFAKAPGPRAAAPQEPSAMDRLIALEKQVLDLQTQLAAAKKAPGQPSVSAGPTPEQYADLRRQMDEMLAYVEAQSQSAKSLAEALEDSREKGFTYGINPDSRVVLLDGFAQFTTALQTKVPQLVPPVGNPVLGN